MSLTVLLAYSSLNHHNRSSCPSSPISAYFKDLLHSMYDMSSLGHHPGVDNWKVTVVCCSVFFFFFYVRSSCIALCALDRRFPVSYAITTHLEATTKVGPRMRTEMLKAFDTLCAFSLPKKNISSLITGYTSSISVRVYQGYGLPTAVPT